ncbi:hypothetical protein [Salipiger sp. CCB-MM3]|uniref:hypothetical protein n=1 Tax=Salipiger sp. CCB-MM3 TaxID=1792508 RepID=UPI00187DC443|nr:hypothetical protein [Salipiger sp. CCB-MM3]
MSSERRLTAMRPVLSYSLVPICLSALLVACTNFPEFDGAQSPGVATAPFPDLVPLSGLLAAPAPIRAEPEVTETVSARAEALRRRASSLQGDVVQSSARTRMDQGVRTDLLIAPESADPSATESISETEEQVGDQTGDQTGQ